jgi:hypothetical protein
MARYWLDFKHEAARLVRQDHLRATAAPLTAVDKPCRQMTITKRTGLVAICIRQLALIVAAPALFVASNGENAQFYIFTKLGKLVWKYGTACAIRKVVKIMIYFKAMAIASVFSACVLPAISEAETIYLHGTVTSASDMIGVLDGVDLQGEPFKGGIKFNDDPACGQLHPCLHQIGPVIIGSLLLDFGLQNSDLFSKNYPKTLYMRPFSPATVQGDGVDFKGFSDGTFTLFSDQTVTWEFTVGNFYGAAKMQFIGTAHVAAPIPEPEIYAMMLVGIGMVGFATRRRKQARI